ncbi:hypothetical protein FHS21_006005 [Phyllobacterium trifolii]|uniref:Uncharacterized protein n=1 Tax=Phyllobacterium trifolii TaxID=300193 RepID=A0A839ULS1_9HYPH|nr:hypothetical protein [Phyllobacterium trifolii]MBB3149551.1 hypothetical protein [Phyllobacterium trifolii]
MLLIAASAGANTLIFRWLARLATIRLSSRFVLQQQPIAAVACSVAHRSLSLHGAGSRPAYPQRRDRPHTSATALGIARLAYPTQPLDRPLQHADGIAMKLRRC